jgi:hypothetical protein
MKALAIVAIVFVIFTAGVIWNASGEGIVILEGYPEGAAFCESEYGTVFHSSEATSWNDGVATYVINTGHENDPEVKELILLANKYCLNLAGENP